jgi:hypothetical protein
VADFKKLSAARPQEAPTDPFRIFQRLPKPQHINDLWESQSEALKLWNKRRTERDLVIKLNTGGGKTLVGLLIGQALLNEMRRPVLYLCPTRQLVQQTLEKALEVSITAAAYETGPGDLPTVFLNSGGLLIATYSAVFHGRSKFGVQGGGSEPVSVGAIICDDAHVALSAVRDQFTITVSRQTYPELYQDLCTRFRTDFAQAGRVGSFDDIVEREEQGVVEVPYSAWAAKGPAIRELLARTYSDQFRYTLPLLRDHFDSCHALIGSREFSITALLPLVSQLPTFEECPRRIYMSATIADDSSIIRTFDAGEKAIREPIIPDTLAGVGERMILAPSLMRFTSGSDRTVAQNVVRSVCKDVNVVILVPSEAAAERWKSVATISMGDAIDKSIADLHSGEPKGPYVFANRYDGLDLLGDACRLLVIDGLPKAASAYDNFRSEVLRASSSLNLSLAQKVEQGLGRGTRGAGDYCVVLLVGSDLTAWITRHDSLELMTPSTRAQVNMGHEISKDIGSGTDLVATLQQCLQRDPDWMRYHAETLADRAEAPKTDEAATAAAVAEREYLRAFAQRSYAEAANIAREYAVQHNTDRRLRGWFLQLAARAAYYGQDLVGSDELQREAFRANAMLWLPSGTGDLYVPTTQVGNQAEAIMTQIARFALPNGHLQDFDDVISCLTPSATSNQLEQSLRRLGEFLGFHAERPEQDYKVGPDVLWLPTEPVGFVLESKGNKKGGGSLGKAEHGQLLVSEKWFLQHYPDRRSICVILHPNNVATEPAMAHTTLALTFENLAKLTSSLRFVLQEVCLSHGSTQQRMRLCDKLLRQYNLTMPELGNVYFQRFEVA